MKFISTQEENLLIVPEVEPRDQAEDLNYL